MTQVDKDSIYVSTTVYTQLEWNDWRYIVITGLNGYII